MAPPTNQHVHRSSPHSSSVHRYLPPIPLNQRFSNLWLEGGPIIFLSKHHPLQSRSSLLISFVCASSLFGSSLLRSALPSLDRCRSAMISERGPFFIVLAHDLFLASSLLSCRRLALLRVVVLYLHFILISSFLASSLVIPMLEKPFISHGSRLVAQGSMQEAPDLRLGTWELGLGFGAKV